MNDGVMGGRSHAQLRIDDKGYGVFEGSVSLRNNGGFCSIQLSLSKTMLHAYKKLVLRVKGDGKRYQFRIKSMKQQEYAYVHYFNTTKHWEEITLRLSDFYPSYRGRRVNLPNYDGQQVEQLSFLIANKKEERFELNIDHIAFQ